MSSENLERLAKAKQLKAEPPARRELQGLLRRGRKQLADARLPDLSLESRFDIAYGAAHAFSLENRYLVFQCLQHTLGLGPEHWRVLALCHERRNSAEYYGIFEVDEQLMAELIEATDIVLAKVIALGPPK